jgi:hypothetical protein
MFSCTLKRSAATLGVVAGLLAAAGPASAQILDGPVLAKAGPQPEAGGYKAPKPSVVIDLNDPFFRLAGHDTLYARGTQVGSEGVTDNGVPLEIVSFTFKGEVIGLEPNALGTQVGSEGVKANNLRGEAIDIIP